MTPAIIGTLGVGLLLVAFVFNLLRRLPECNRIYLLMNFGGAALAAWYAHESGTMPFVVLETVWALSALVRLMVVIKKGSPF